MLSLQHHAGKWAPDAAVVAKAKEIATTAVEIVEVTNDPESCCTRMLQFLYTDVWMSMGDSESVIEPRKMKALSPFAVTDEPHEVDRARILLFMHCLTCTSWRRG
jgi:ornithine carbamoyltransferase